MSRVLVDTHVFLFLVDDVERVPRSFHRAIDEATERYLSAASAWEMVIKVSLGKLRLPESAEKYIPSRTSELLMRSLPITQRHAVRAGTLPLLHRDPFDRMLVAQSLEEDLLLLTLDPRVLRYGVRAPEIAERRAKRSRRR